MAGSHDPTVTSLIDALRKVLKGRYEVVRLINHGATGFVFEVEEQSLGHKRALKLLRPGLPDIDLGGMRRSFSDYFAKEIERLAAITHENVVQVYEKGVLKSVRTPLISARDLPFYVMEYLPGDDVDKFLTTNFGQLSSRNLLDLVVQLGAGLRAIHSAGVVHGDVKPSNIRVSHVPESSFRLKLTDFGFAKSLSRPVGESTFWCQDRGYLHPELQYKLLRQQIAQPEDLNRTIIRVTDQELRDRAVWWELHAIGKTIQTILNIVEPRLTERDVRFLRITCLRLIDAREQPPWMDAPRSDSYVTVQALADDLGKLARPHGLGGDAPEFHRHYRQSLRVPLCEHIPWTGRLKEIVDHPLVQRLARVSQLGVVNLAFRSGTHCRLEHSFGVLWHGIQYLRALWHSASGAYFRQVVRQEDCEAFVIATLLHDLGQYPFAHAFEESDIQRRIVYGHGELSKRLFTAKDAQDVVGSTDLLPLFEAQPLTQIEGLLRDHRGNLLCDIVSGKGALGWGVDLDDVLFLLSDRQKGDEPRRPSLEILRRIINGPIDADKMDYLRRDALHLGFSLGGLLDFSRLLQVLTVVETAEPGIYDLAVHEDGVGVAQDIHYLRYRMFVEVYWSKVARSAERMLRHAVDGLRQTLGDAAFARCFFAEVLTSTDFELLTRLIHIAERETAEFQGDTQRVRLHGCCELLRAVDRRYLHHEALEIAAERYPELDGYLSNFWGWAISNPAANLEFADFSDRLFQNLRSIACKGLQQHQVLLDIPDPRTDSPAKYAVLVRTREGGVKPIAERSPIWRDYARLFRTHGRRIRVFADRAVLHSLPQETILVSLHKAFEDVRESRYFQQPPAESGELG